MSDEVEFRERVVKGIPVNWYPKAMMDREPKAAIVYSANANGSADLFVIEDGGTLRVRACYHRSCKSSLYDHAGKKLPHVMETGCWDFNELSSVLYSSLKKTQDSSPEKESGVLVGDKQGDGKPAVKSVKTQGGGNK